MRAWIIQEIAVAKEAIVVSGKDQSPWKTFEFRANFILQYSLIALAEVDPTLTIKLAEFRGSQLGEDTRSHLLHYLTQARDSFATDDSDKTYAILGWRQKRTRSR